MLREALGLWRGDAFGEFLDVEACEAEGRRLEEMRLVVTEDRIDADLAAGAASELVAELESLVARHEFRERLWAQLMLALYRSGRQRDALAAYRRARETLVEQLGIEPGRELRELEAAILEQDPALDCGRSLPAGSGCRRLLEAVGPAFVGRDAELARLRTAWLDAADGRGGFVSVLGPEGIGKTRLVAELAREVQRAGGRRSCTAGAVTVVRGSAPCSTGVLHDAAPRWTSWREPTGELGAAVMQLSGHPFRRPAGPPRRRRRPPRRRRHHRGARRSGRLVAAGPLLVVATFRTERDAAPVRCTAGSDVGAQVVLGGLDRDVAAARL